MKAEGIIIESLLDDIDVSISRKDYTKVIFFDSVLDLVAHLKASDTFLVIDKKIIKLFGQQIKPLVKRKATFLLRVSEKQKNWNNLAIILDQVIASNVSRKGTIVAIGGGVVTDMTGLIANLYFRGVKSVLVPTTLLAMVDAAIGGKVAVNHPHQKNLLGSFYHPSEVLISTEFLTSIPKRHMYNAAGEIFKLSVISDNNLFSIIEQAPAGWIKNKTFLKRIIKICITEKLQMLGENCFERDLRRPLNLGHSIAHPLEDITGYKVFHGEAVSYGLLIASNISLQRGLISMTNYLRIYNCAKRFGCTINIENYGVEELWNRIRRLIIQRGGNGLLYVLPTAIGKTTIVKDITHKELTVAIACLKRESKLT